MVTPIGDPPKDETRRDITPQPVQVEGSASVISGWASTKPSSTRRDSLIGAAESATPNTSCAYR